MSDTSTNHIIDMYLEEASAPMFLSGFFRSPPQNFHTSEFIEIDIVRDNEDVAIVIQDLTVAPRHNELTLYTNKRFTPPIFDEEGAISSYDMIKRQAGQNPFDSPEYGANAVRNAFAIYRKLEQKIRRAVELMCAQVLQTGKLLLTNGAGTALYEIDFLPKASHNVTPVVPWAVDGTTGNPLGDLTALAGVLRRDGKSEPKRAIFGDQAFARFIANPAVQKSLDVRRMEVGSIAPETRGLGATFQGRFWLGHYQLEIWTYDGFYRNPVTGLHSTYIDTNKVVVMGDGRLDLTFGAIPILVPPDRRVLPFLPPRISSQGRGLDLTTNAWCTPDGKHVMVSAGTRPMAIPTAIDTFGSLTVAPP